MNKIFKSYFATERNSSIVWAAGDTIGQVIDKIKADDRDPNDFNFYQISDLVIYQLKIKVD